MPPLKKKQKRLRTIGSQGGYSKKIRQTTESENQSSSVPANIPVFQQNNSIPPQPGPQLSILAEEDATLSQIVTKQGRFHMTNSY